MTNEEAKRIAQGLITDFKCESETMVEFCNVVIKALEQEPCNDAISRKAVLDTTICEGISCNECSFNEIDGEPGCLLHARIDELPSVTQKSETVTEFADRCRECGAKYGKLLKQEPCEDAISRQAVDTLVDELARAISDERCCISRGRSTATIMRDIYHLPPVNPQKSGTWIKEKRIEGWDGYSYQCSVCGRSIHIDSVIEELSDHPYCHCGAKMVDTGK